ncbi:MAG: hypothetical protein AVDCRST_MAG64-1653, partial [uncultured Phycisphaerae bacterium]
CSRTETPAGQAHYTKTGSPPRRGRRPRVAAEKRNWPRMNTD